MDLYDILAGKPSSSDAADFYLMLKHAGWEDPVDTSGELEGTFAAPIEEVIAKTSEVATVKLRLHTAYQVYAEAMRGFAPNVVGGQHAVGDQFHEHAEQERLAAETYLKRASVLSGGPIQFGVIDPPPATANPEEIIQHMIRAEQEGIYGQRELHAMVGDDNPFKYFIEQYMMEDQHHLDELWQLLPKSEQDEGLALQQESEQPQPEQQAEPQAQQVQNQQPQQKPGTTVSVKTAAMNQHFDARLRGVVTKAGLKASKKVNTAFLRPIRKRIELEKGEGFKRKLEGIAQRHSHKDPTGQLTGSELRGWAGKRSKFKDAIDTEGELKPASTALSKHVGATGSYKHKPTVGEHIRKHKNKYIAGIAAGGGIGVGTYAYNKHKQEKTADIRGISPESNAYLSAHRTHRQKVFDAAKVIGKAGIDPENHSDDFSKKKQKVLDKAYQELKPSEMAKDKAYNAAMSGRSSQRATRADWNRHLTGRAQEQRFENIVSRHNPMSTRIKNSIAKHPGKAGLIGGLALGTAAGAGLHKYLTPQTASEKFAYRLAKAAAEFDANSDQVPSQDPLAAEAVSQTPVDSMNMTTGQPVPSNAPNFPEYVNKELAALTAQHQNEANYFREQAQSAAMQNEQMQQAAQQMQEQLTQIQQQNAQTAVQSQVMATQAESANQRALNYSTEAATARMASQKLREAMLNLAMQDPNAQDPNAQPQQGQDPNAVVQDPTGQGQQPQQEGAQTQPTEAPADAGGPSGTDSTNTSQPSSSGSGNPNVTVKVQGGASGDGSGSAGTAPGKTAALLSMRLKTAHAKVKQASAMDVARNALWHPLALPLAGGAIGAYRGYKQYKDQDPEAMRAQAEELAMAAQQDPNFANEMAAMQASHGANVATLKDRYPTRSMLTSVAGGVAKGVGQGTMARGVLSAAGKAKNLLNSPYA